VSKTFVTVALLGTVSLNAGCSSDHPAAVEENTADTSDAGDTDVGDTNVTDGGADGRGDSGTALAARACDDDLKALDLGAGATVTLVKAFKKGDGLSLLSVPPAGAPKASADVCLVKILVGPGNPGPTGAPSTSSGIGIEVWLPAPANWNERYQAVGGGGYEGGPSVTSLTAIGSLLPPHDPVTPAMAGFVASITDAGHSGDGQGSFAMNPDGTFNETLFRDFAERSQHEMSLKTKALIKAFYGKDAKYSYWAGCSDGGRQGLMEVQRHPEDFDGVLAAAPAINFDRVTVTDLWPQIVMQQELGGPIERAKLAAVTAAANAACGTALTGQGDGYISDPFACRYDPTADVSLLCVSAGGTNATSACLTNADATAVNKIWYGPTSDGTAPAPSADNGQGPVAGLAPNQLWFEVTRGTLLAGHIYWDGQAGQKPFTVATDSVALALGDSSYAQANFVNATGIGQNKWRTIGYTGATSFAEVFAAARKRLGEIGSTSNPDIGAFSSRGGKLLMWHGTSDSLVPPQGSINYYEAVSASLGGYAEAQKFARFYLAPGIDHCMLAGVPGTNPPVPGGRVDNPNAAMIDVLQKWVENGEAPDQIVATSAAGVTPVRKRPWCLYPKKLKYVSGDVNTGDFTCE